MLVHTQMPGARFVAPPHRWLNEYRRTIRSEARPLVILQPMGPVMFVFDVSDTVPENDAPPLPPDVEHPFEVRGGRVKGELRRTTDNAIRDGIHVAERDAGSQNAGEIRSANSNQQLWFQTKWRPKAEFEPVPLRYQVLLNSRHSPEAKYATLVHELGHLYCGHLGTPNDRWWPDRRGLDHAREEFEAESVCYLVCSRLGIDNPSEAYLASYLRDSAEIPDISLECVMKAAGLIEQMGRSRLKVRKRR